ncbi:hypothetical protein L3Q82_002807 [Scortum barcoo]|uniref:Uncharacterized protein n=1 Tax=Scortum barcoo TaxID=214431 RepID=A0ACB8VUY1_9TELE|nr:hypothetical protein L3Q82_002807 [Scortum barcoo]
MERNRQIMTAQCGRKGGRSSRTLPGNVPPNARTWRTEDHGRIQIDSPPPLGKSDHNLVHLQPLYTPLVQKQPVTTRSVRRWSPEKESALRDCFNTTVWDVLMNPHGEDIEGMTHCLTDYLNFCADVVSPVKTVRCYPNNKPSLGG